MQKLEIVWSERPVDIYFYLLQDHLFVLRLDFVVCNYVLVHPFEVLEFF